MFDSLAIADLDAGAACEAVEATQAALREHQWREPGLLMGVGFIAASTLLRDAVDLRVRHPLLWAAAAEARREAAALARFVATGQADEHGLRTLIARAHAGEVIYFVAMCDRIAQILALRGDTDLVDVRRSKALAILANPAGALALLEEHATDEPHPDDPDRSPLASPAPANACGSCGGPRLDPEKLRPRAVLHVRISELALTAGSGWQLRQPTAGVYLWRTRHGYWYRVDNDGTHRLGRDPDLTPHDPPIAHSPMEQILADLVASS